MFSPDVQKIFCRSLNFAENENDENDLGQGLINMVDGVEQTSLNLIFFCAKF